MTLESIIKIRDLVVSIEMISSTMPDNYEIRESLRGVELEYAKQIQIGNCGFSDCRFGTIHFLEKIKIFGMLINYIIKNFIF